MQPDQSIVGQQVTVSVSVSGSGGTPTGTVTVNGESVAQPCSFTLSGGSGSCNIAFTAPGNHRVTATYTGDSRFGGSSDEDTHQVNAAPNLAPVTQPDEYSTNEDTPLSVSAGDGVLRNDQDPEGGPLTAVNASDAANGSVDLNENGSFTYTPDPNFFGDDTFTYRAKDNVGNETTETVTIHVALVNDAPSFELDGTNLNVSPGQPITLQGWAKEISPGPNEAGQPVTFQVTTNNDALFSQAPSITPDGTLSFTTSGPESGTETITVTVVLQDDGGGTSSSQQFTITSGPGLMARQAP
jgi:VCBS repeat-containing protein